MSQKSLAIRGVVFNWMGRGCGFAIAIFLTPFLVRTLGDERYGLWSLLMSLTSYYAIADLGLRSAATKYISQYHAIGDHHSVNKVANTALAAYSGLALILIMGAACFGSFFTEIFQTEALSPTKAQILVLLTAGTVAMKLIVQVFQGSIVSMQQHGISNAGSVISQLVAAVGVVLSLQAGFGLIGMACVTFSVALCGNAASFLIAWKLMPELRFGRKYLCRETFKQIFCFGGVSSIAGIARRLSEQFAVVVIAFMFGPALVTFYAIPNTILQKVSTLARGMNTSFFPAVSVMDAQGDHDQLRGVLIDLLRACLTISLSMAGVFFFMGRNIIELWIGKAYVEESYPLMLILSVAFVCRMFATPIRTYLRGAAHLQPIVVVASLEAVLTVGLGIGLAFLWELQGIALSVAITQVIICLIFLPLVTSRLIEMKISRFWKTILLPVLPACAPAIFVAFLLSNWVTPTRLMHLVPLVGVVMSIAGVGILIFCFNRKRRKEIVSALTFNKLRPGRDQPDREKTASPHLPEPSSP